MFEFTLIPMFATFLNGFTLMEGCVECDNCLTQVVHLTEGTSLHGVVTAAVEHRCDE